MKKVHDPRHKSRAIALLKIFEEKFAEDKSIKNRIPFKYENLAEIVDETKNKYDKQLLDKILEGVREEKPTVRKLIEKHAPKWPIDKIQKIDLAILEIAIFEGFIGKITPPKVAIDEGIELAKEFSGEQSAKFINGVLGGIFESYAEEFKKDEKSKKIRILNRDKCE
ncbi:MAG TPA: transcription antitermination factor NusB [bacterium]|nr:transcription antitermination factor NusB [bacterium]